MNGNTKHDPAPIIHGYLNGQTIPELANAHNAPYTAIQKIIRTHDLAGFRDARYGNTTKQLPPETINRIRQLHKSGASYNEIKRRTGIGSSATITKYKDA